MIKLTPDCYPEIYQSIRKNERDRVLDEGIARIQKRIDGIFEVYRGETNEKLTDLPFNMANGMGEAILILKELRQGKASEQPVQTEPSSSLPEGWRDPNKEPPEYEDCPCWISPCDPESTRGNCEGSGGDCKLWHHDPYTECKYLATGCTSCDEILCKHRN
jgi:hypothetical protein